MSSELLSVSVDPNWEGLVDCIMRKGTPDRVHFIELFLDSEVQQAIAERYGLLDGLDPDGEFFVNERMIRVQRFLGYDFVRCGLDDVLLPVPRIVVEDTADLAHESGRHYADEHEGPIMAWEDLNAYEWPDPAQCPTTSLEWYSENLPDDMCIIGRGLSHYAENLSGLMGYETLCYALFDQRDLVAAIADRLFEFYKVVLARILEFDRVKIIWGSDDMGFKNGPLISPDDLREFVLPGHKLMAEMSHAAGRPYLLHSCGKLDTIMPDLIDDVGIDAKHSFEDTIESVIDRKREVGDRIALLGGIDVDFLCRASEDANRARVRETLEVCQPGGGYCLGSGNSVANYIPLDNFLVMIDEGRRWFAG